VFFLRPSKICNIVNVCNYNFCWIQNDILCERSEREKITLLSILCMEAYLKNQQRGSYPFEATIFMRFWTF